MEKHKFTLVIEARSNADAEQKVKSLTTLASNLSAKELEKLTYVVKNDPVKTALAKKYLDL
jgi:hypothetical protein